MSNRRCKTRRGLRVLEADPRDYRVFAFDTETCPQPWNPEGTGEHHMIYGTVYDGEQHYEFRDRRAMATFMTSRRWSGWRGWAANLDYDCNAIFEEHTWPIYRTYFSGILKSADLRVRTRTRTRVTRGKYGHGKAKRREHRADEKVRLYDTFNQWEGSVAAYGELLNHPKLDMPISEIGPTVTEKLRVYCQRDAEVVWQMVTRMQGLYNSIGTELKASIAATALDLFRRRYLDPAHEHRHLAKGFTNQARECYYGARTENFIVGTAHDITVADVNSMYPSVMATTRLPLFDTMHLRRTIPDTGEGFAMVDIEVPDCEYPPLPMKWDKLYFPIGRWIGCFTLNELRYAITQGVVIHRVIGCVHMPESAIVFADYVRDLYTRRVATDDPVLRLCYKKLMNALYGKFGSAGSIVQYIPSYEEAGVITKLGWRKVTKAGEPAPYANFLWAAYITAGARIHLHELLVRHRGLYCDTDSVFTRDTIPATTELGELSHKYLASEVEIRAPKVYRTDRETRVKGVRRADGRPLPDDGRFTYRKPTRFRESLIRGCRPNTWGEVERVLKYQSNKRAYYPDGTSRPLTVREIARRPRVKITVSPLVLPAEDGRARVVLPIRSPIAG